MTLTIDKVVKALPQVSSVNIDKFGQTICDAASLYGIYTPNREAAFLSQVAWESMWFTHTTENLNYSAESLRATWPFHFPTVASAVPFEHNPEKIANRVYADRYGNGKEDSGDGYKYRGRGLLQITFKDNYKAFSAWVVPPHDCLIDPDYLLGVPGAVLSSMWFWTTHKLNEYADSAAIVQIIHIISGGSLNISQRLQAYDIALKGVS